MAVLWQMTAATVADVVAALEKTRPVTYSTTQTMLRILETKGYVAHDKVGRAFRYRCVIDEHQARRHALRQLANRLFNGSASLLVLNALEDDQIDPLELKRLKRRIANC
jgi:BlaI family transcriptional regulator, penicillinase repressor